MKTNWIILPDTSEYMFGIFINI